MVRRIYPGPPGEQGPPGPAGGVDPWDTVQWVNDESTVPSEDGSIGAPWLQITDALLSVDQGGTIFVGPGLYNGITLADGRIIHIVGLGDAEGVPGGHASINGVTLGNGGGVRLETLALTDPVTGAGTGGALYCSEVAFGDNDINTPAWAVRLVGSILEPGSVGEITCDTLHAQTELFTDDITATSSVTLLECDFAGAITITAPSITIDAQTQKQAADEGVIFTTTPILLETSDGIENLSGVAGSTVTAALDALDALIGALAGIVAGLVTGVSSVFGRAGAVTAQAGDYTAAQVTGAVADTRTITAGAGLTGGGNLSADRTIDVGANADGSIAVNANDIQVGVLATDAQHGNRGGGGIHADATTSVAGFLPAADKIKLNNLFPPTQGTNLGNADSTMQPNAGTSYNLPAATLSANRNYTWGTTGAVAGLLMVMNIEDVSGNEKQTTNGGAGGGVVVPAAVTTALASTRYSAMAQYDGTNWVYVGVTFI